MTGITSFTCLDNLTTNVPTEIKTFRSRLGKLLLQRLLRKRSPPAQTRDGSAYIFVTTKTMSSDESNCNEEFVSYTFKIENFEHELDFVREVRSDERERICW